MLRNIRAVGNSRGIIIPKAFLEELGSPSVVDISLVDRQVVIRPGTGKITRGKPREPDETTNLYSIMDAKIDSNIRSGKVRWISPIELVRRL